MTVQEYWEDFESRVIPKEAEEQQRAEMRMAFVSGMLLYGVEILGNRDKNLAIEVFTEANKYKTKQALEVYKETK